MVVGSDSRDGDCFDVVVPSEQKTEDDDSANERGDAKKARKFK